MADKQFPCHITVSHKMSNLQGIADIHKLRKKSFKIVEIWQNTQPSRFHQLTQNILASVTLRLVIMSLMLYADNAHNNNDNMLMMTTLTTTTATTMMMMITMLSQVSKLSTKMKLKL